MKDNLHKIIIENVHLNASQKSVLHAVVYLSEDLNRHHFPIEEIGIYAGLKQSSIFMHVKNLIEEKLIKKTLYKKSLRRVHYQIEKKNIKEWVGKRGTNEKK